MLRGQPLPGALLAAVVVPSIGGTCCQLVVPRQPPLTPPGGVCLRRVSMLACTSALADGRRPGPAPAGALSGVVDGWPSAVAVSRRDSKARGRIHTRHHAPVRLAARRGARAYTHALSAPTPFLRHTRARYSH